MSPDGGKLKMHHLPDTDSISVVVTGAAWMGAGIGSIESALERLLREATAEVILSVYSISAATDRVIEWVELALARGVFIRMVVIGLDSQPVPVVRRLRELARQYPHFLLYSFTPANGADLHAKAVVVDRRLALIGSSNLSRRGLLLNHEMAVLVEGTAAAACARALDRLLSSNYVQLERSP